MKMFLLLAVVALSLVACNNNSTPSAGPVTPAQDQTPATRPDNTGMNARDKSGDMKTADKAGQDQPDLDIAAKIRKQIVDTKLSMNAQNCKVIVKDDKVTLRGPVNSQDEKDQIEKLAAGVVGPGNVDNQLEVKPNP